MRRKKAKRENQSKTLLLLSVEKRLDDIVVRVNRLQEQRDLNPTPVICGPQVTDFFQQATRKATCNLVTGIRSARLLECALPLCNHHFRPFRSSNSLLDKMEMER